MGLILKIVIFAVVAYGIWTTANRWFNLLGGNRRPPAPQPPPAAPASTANRPQAPREKPRVVEDTHPCTVCGAYVSAGAGKCSRPDCPQG